LRHEEKEPRELVSLTGKDAQYVVVSVLCGVAHHGHFLPFVKSAAVLANIVETVPCHRKDPTAAAATVATTIKATSFLRGFRICRISSLVSIKGPPNTFP